MDKWLQFWILSGTVLEPKLYGLINRAPWSTDYPMDHSVGTTYMYLSLAYLQIAFKTIAGDCASDRDQHATELKK